MIALARRLTLGLIPALLLITLSLSVSASASTRVDVRISGVEGELLNNVKAYLQIANLDSNRDYVNYQIRYLHRQATKEIKQALQPFGYYRVDVTSELQPIEAGAWRADYQIALNDPVLVTQNQWHIIGEGAEHSALNQVIEKSPLQRGERFVHSRYESLKSALLSQAIQLGYQDARFKHSTVTVDMEEQTAAIDVRFDTGPRYYVGELTVTDSHLNKGLLERYARFKPGEPFLNSSLSQLQVDLSNSDYFSQVTVSGDWQQANEDQQVPVSVATKPNERTQYRLGVGYGTDTGARVTAGVERRWVNDYGHQFRSLVQLAQYESQATAVYQIPGLKPQSDYRQYRAEVGDRENDSLDSRLYKVAAVDVFSYDQWQREYRLSLLREDFTLGEQRTQSNFLVPALEWRYLQADDRINVNNGWRLALGLRGASESMLSETDVIQGYAELKSVWSLGSRWRLLNRVEIGASYTDAFELLPPTLRFFAGGDNSVRGYAYEQLGPTDETGAVIGGKYLVVASAELDYQFASNWRVAVFTDVGNTMIEPNKALKQSVGLGFRWISPVGAIRLDVAQAIDEPGNPWRIHFTLGPDL